MRCGATARTHVQAVDDAVDEVARKARLRDEWARRAHWV